MARGKYPRSRFGCSNCRKRHVKCDENAPCRHCVRRKENCSLEKSPSSATSGSSYDLPSVIRSPAPLSVFDDGDWALEMFLMHHYTIYTCRSFYITKAIGEAFQVEVPRLSMSHPILLSAILSAAALHILVVGPYDKRYSLAYRKHGTKVIEELQKNLNNITHENSNALFACSSLLGFFTITENWLDDGLTAETGCARLAQSMYMFVGTAEIVRKEPLSIALGPMKPLLHGHWVDIPADFALAEDASNALQALRTGIDDEVALSIEDRNCLVTTWKILEMMYRETAYLMVTSTPHANHILKFTIMVPQSYIWLVQSGDNWAVLLFTYFAVLCTPIQGVWSLNKKYADKIVQFARSFIDPIRQTLLNWPEAQVENDLSSLLGSKRTGESGEAVQAKTWKEALTISDVTLEQLGID